MQIENNTTELPNAARMRALDRATIAAGRISGTGLMENAGRAVVDAILRTWPALARTDHRALVLCGPGNNGGDGFVIARLLHQRGWQVRVCLLGDPARLPDDARTNLERWRALGTVDALSADHPPDTGAGRFDLIVDGLFGTGLGRPVAPWLIGLVDTLREGTGPQGTARVVAVDIPSGLCADSGRPLGGRAVSADLTVTFHAAKPGHYLDRGPDFCGRLVVADIGIRPERDSQAAEGGDDDTPPAMLMTGPAVSLAKDAGSHKYGHGHALVLSGPATRTGAARLAARAALRVGAGLVTLGSPRDALAENAAQLNAIMLREIHDAQALAALLDDRRINALCLGPGLSHTRARALVPPALGAAGPRRRAVVLDADALTAWEGAPDDLFDLLHPHCVLTPHGGEFARLFADLAEDLARPATQGPAFSRLDAVRQAARRAGCVVLLKGRDTVIASPDGRLAVNAAAYERAAPWLATAGSGDVLAGLITGLLARGADAFSAACTAAWLHVEAARAFGPGLVAEDLPETLPAVLARLETG